MQAPTHDAQQQQPSGPPYDAADGQLHDQQVEQGQDRQLHSADQPQDRQPAVITSDVVAALDQHYGQPQYLLGPHHACEYADEHSSDAQQQLLLQQLAAAQQVAGAGEGDVLDGVQPGFQEHQAALYVDQPSGGYYGETAAVLDGDHFQPVAPAVPAEAPDGGYAFFDGLHKSCSKCKQVKAASDFHKSKRRRLGLHIYCKTCCAAASASRAKTKQPVTQPTVEVKARAECSRCKQTKPAGEYFRDKWRATGLCSYCKACSAASVARKHELSSSEEPTVSSKVPSMSSQVCTKCKIEKDSSQFHRNTLTASGLVSRCKQCIAEADAKRYDRIKVKEGRAAPRDVTKQCSQCGEAKPGTCFSPNTTSPDGLRSNCKDCQSKAAARCRRQRAVPVEQRFYDEAHVAVDRQPHEGAQGLQTEQQLAEAVQRATTQQTADMPVILYNEHGQALIQPYLQLQQHYEARCGMKPLSIGLPVQPDMQLLQQLQPADHQPPQAALQLDIALGAPHAELPLAGTAAEAHEAVMTFRQDLVSV